MVDKVCFEETPLKALRMQSRFMLSMFLDPIKILPTFNYLFRDWRGILHLSGLKNECESYISSKSNPTNELINILVQEQPHVTLASFVKMLEDIDRWDAIDDTHEMLVLDAIEFKNNYKKCSVENQPEYALTFDDVKSVQQNLQLPHYHAFVLSSKSDIKFANEIIRNLELSGLKLCSKERDFLPGLSFEHNVIRKLLTERCDRLIVILSPDFVMSPLNAFITNVAESLGIEEQKRKIIPCLYKSCKKPSVFDHIHPLNYEGSEVFGNFWEKLTISLEALPRDSKCAQSTAPGEDPLIIGNSMIMKDTRVQIMPSTSLAAPNRKVKRNKRRWLQSLFVF